MFKLKVFSGATMFTIHRTVRGGSHVKLGLHVDNVGKANADRIGLKEVLHEEAEEDMKYSTVEPQRCDKLAHPSKIAPSTWHSIEIHE